MAAILKPRINLFDIEVLDAMKKGNRVKLKELIDQGLPVNIISSYKTTSLLTMAIGYRSEDLVRLLIENGANVNINTSKSPLLLAIELRLNNVVILLLQAGANIKQRDVWQRTPLHKAASIGDLLIINTLLIYHADKNAIDCFNFTPKHLAVRAGCDTRIIELLS